MPAPLAGLLTVAAIKALLLLIGGLVAIVLAIFFLWEFRFLVAGLLLALVIFKYGVTAEMDKRSKDAVMLIAVGAGMFGILSQTFGMVPGAFAISGFVMLFGLLKYHDPKFKTEYAMMASAIGGALIFYMFGDGFKQTTFQVLNGGAIVKKEATLGDAISGLFADPVIVGMILFVMVLGMVWFVLTAKKKLRGKK